MDLPFVPMLLERVPAPFADARWLFQVKWDGVRNLCLIDGGCVRHWSRRLRDRTTHFPELDGLARVFAGTRAVLDGEIIVLKEGKPSFSTILERDVGGSAPDPRKVKSTPATFMVFDLLEYGDRPLYGAPLEERTGLLERLLAPADAWQPVTSFPGGQGPDLFQATTESGLEGVVAKRLGSQYLPGTRSRDWLKIKRRQRLLAVICGYTAPAGRPGGLLLGAYKAGRLRYIGRAGSGISSEQLSLIKSHLPPSPCPFDYRPPLADRFSGPPGPVVWTTPALTALVEFTEWTEEAKLRDPVIVGFSAEPADSAIIP